MISRYHCNEEMRYLGMNEQGHGFECVICEFLEYAHDPNAPTTPEETPRPSLLEYGNKTKIGNK